MNKKLTVNFISSINSQIPVESFVSTKSSLFIKREDLLHPNISGNKYRKLKYNILEAQKLNFTTLLTFGGAYSNHIAATAKVGKEYNIRTIGIIRGEEIKDKNLNPTLLYAGKCGMKLHFVSREEYKLKTEANYIEKLKVTFGNFYLLPEGGTNQLAVKGCEEILTSKDKNFNYICASVGTGGTIAGIINASENHQTVLGFSALKGTFQDSEIKKYTSKRNYKITDSYCFGGYAKIDSELIRFINEFRKTTGIPLDPIYTGKLMYGILDLLKKGELNENSSILAIHTGGLQSISGMNQQLKKKNLPQIKV